VSTDHIRYLARDAFGGDDLVEAEAVVPTILVNHALLCEQE